MDAADEIYWSVRRKGVRLWLEDGRLRYQAPKGVLTTEDAERVRTVKHEIITRLQERRPQRGWRHPVPLTYSQLLHWHLYRLDERPAIRQVATAIRLLGSLHVEALRSACAQTVLRHDALRTRIVLVNAVPMQEVATGSGPELRFEDLAVASPSQRESRVLQAIDEQVLEPVDIRVDSLLAVRLLRLRQDEHVLILAMEHIISDAVSLGVLTRDLLLAYARSLQDRDQSLPETPLQFTDYAAWQCESEREWLERHGGYWKQSLAQFERMRFPDELRGSATSRHGTGTVCFRIERTLKKELVEWSRLQRTTLAMTVFTAYAASVLQWCGASEGIVLYAIDGRTDQNMANTIGYFASVLYLRVRIHSGDTFADLAERITAEYCIAYEHADFSYLSANRCPPEFSYNPAFNWIARPPAVNGIDGHDGTGEISCSPVDFTHPMGKVVELDREPGVMLYDSAEEVTGAVGFGLSRFSDESMQRFTNTFMRFVQALAREPGRRVADVPIL